LQQPEGVRIVPFYDQSLVIDGTIYTVEKNLLEASFSLSLCSWFSWETSGPRFSPLREIADVVVKIGRPDSATEAMGINEGDTYLLFRPMKTWKRFHAKEDLMPRWTRSWPESPGIAHNFTQPMAMRIDETISGVKADLAIKAIAFLYLWSCGRGG
jgi:Cu/Ag efflux pump CusA